jgi:hypothetical protein
VAQPLFVSCPWSLSKPRGASRRAITASSFRHRAALFVGRSMSGPAIPQPAPGGRLILATGRSPGPPGCVLCGNTRAGAASDPTRMTPHESAPSVDRTDRTIFNDRIKVKLRLRTNCAVIPTKARSAASRDPVTTEVMMRTDWGYWIPAFAGTTVEPYFRASSCQAGTE